MTLRQRPATPALAQRPILKAALAADHVPGTAPGRAVDPAQSLQRLMHSTAGIELVFMQFWRPSRTRNTQHRQCAQWLQVRDDKGRLEVPRSIVHGIRNRACAPHPRKRVDDSIVEHRPAVGISLADLFQLPAADLVSA